MKIKLLMLVLGLANFAFAQAPFVTRCTTTSIRFNAVSIHGTVQPNGQATTVTLQADTDGDPYSNFLTDVTTITIPANVSIQNFSFDDVTLLPNVLNKFRLVATNASGSTNSSNYETTPISFANGNLGFNNPVVSNITSNSARVSQILNNGNNQFNINWKVFYELNDPRYTNATWNWAFASNQVAFNTIFQDSLFHFDLTQLQPNSTYFYKVSGIISGSEYTSTVIQTFTTLPTSTNIDQNDKIQFEVYPNPTQNSINLNIENKFNYSIYNSIGVEILKGIGENSTNINTESLTNGIYFINVQNSNGNSIKKFIKE